MLPAQIGRLHPGFVLFQDPYDLFLAEPCFLHFGLPFWRPFGVGEHLKTGHSVNTSKAANEAGQDNSSYTS
jgi:hypothetical protein